AGNYPATSRTAAGILAESLALADETGDLFGRGLVHFWRGVHAVQRGELQQARAAAEAGLAVAQRLTEPTVVNFAWRMLAATAAEAGDPAFRDCIAQALTIARSGGCVRRDVMDTLAVAAVGTLLEGRHGEAALVAEEW